MKSNRAKSILLAALMLGSLTMPACAAKNENPNADEPPAATDSQPVTTEQTADPNIPAFVVGSTSPTEPEPESTEPELTEPQPSVSEDTEQTAPVATVPPETEPPVETEPPAETEPQQTNPEGMIVDDWSAGLDLTQVDPSELYETFGVDRSHREAYNSMISSECGFPIVHVTTYNDSEIVSRDDYVDCFVEVFNCDDVYKLDAAGAGIRVRGNASANYGDVDWIRHNMVSYRLKFTEKQSMLGLNDFARCRSWVLLKPYEAAIENHLAFRVARAVNGGDYYCSDSTFVHLYINEEYIGPYLLCEQTQENSSRIDINEAENGYTGTDIGYLVELDNYATSDDDPYFYLVYNREEITDVSGTTRVPRKYAYSVKNDLYSDEQLKFIERYFEIAWEIPMRAIKYGEYYTYNEDLELVPAQDQFASAYDCINAIFDIDSVVDMYIAYEIINDQDVGGGSFFFAVDFGADPTYDRLTMVAPWDFEWAYMDYSSDSDGGLYVANFKDSNFVDRFGDRSNPWLILFYSADWFRELVRQKWQERLPYINSAIDEVESLVVNHAEDLNKDGERRAGSAKTTINWTRNRVEYLNSLWG